MKSPDVCLKVFMTDLSRWELDAAKKTAECDRTQGNYEQLWHELYDEYMKVFNKHCSPKRSEPRDSAWFSDPPNCDPDDEVFEATKFVTPTVVHIYTQSRRAEWDRYVYELVLEGGDWKVVSRSRIGADGKLVSTNM
jgi:hypothetical protein